MNVSAAGQCEIVAVALQKGSVGKTTTTINLGASLAAMGFRVLLIDMDQQAHSTKGLGVDLGADEGFDGDGDGNDHGCSSGSGPDAFGPCFGD